MKKILIMLGVVALATVSQASYLYWQCTGSETGFANATAGYTITGVQIVNGATKTAATSLVAPDGTAYSYSTDGMPKANVYVDLGTVAVGDTYSWYIEVLGYKQGSSDTTSGVIAQSNTMKGTYASNVAGFTTDLEDIEHMATAMVGTTYSAPEPTSGLLLLVGGALLALRRKRA